MLKRRKAGQKKKRLSADREKMEGSARAIGAESLANVAFLWPLGPLRANLFVKSAVTLLGFWDKVFLSSYAQTQTGVDHTETGAHT